MFDLNVWKRFNSIYKIGQLLFLGAVAPIMFVTQAPLLSLYRPFRR